MHYPLVTLVGGSGFVGRHTVKLFTEKGWRVRVLCRDTVAAEFLKTAGYPGQVVLDYADITRPETLAQKFAGSDAVVNLVSILAESGRQKFTAINVEGAKAIAELAQRSGVKTLVQISALGAGAGDAHYATTKKAGEDAVRAAFPSAVILRPSLIVGPEDGFFQRFARMLNWPGMLALPLIGGGQTKFQPVLVSDVAHAIFNAATDAKCANNTYELAGDKIYNFRELLELLFHTIRRRPRFIPVPGWLLKLIVLDPTMCLVPKDFRITRDQVRMLNIDSILLPGALTLRHMGITPQSVEAALPELLARYVKV